ncbi:MAG: SapC family protein [Burkholderiaceae bacterium]|nr:SapC family protein [Burkholderiaceae bacterium]
MSKLMFYERPIALNRDRHATLKLAVTPDHYRFAAKTNAVPVMSTEFAEAARDYPIVFVGEEGGTTFNVAALVGLRDQENLMVDEAGQWAPGTYVPAFARRYPFVLAKTDASDNLTVCVDEVYSGLGAEAGEALFDAEGKETPYLQRVLEFLQHFHSDAQRTLDFANRLHQLGLLVPKVINVERPGQTLQTLRGLWIVDVAKLRGIDDARVVELFRLGYMSWIEAHLISLGNFSRLLARMG